MARAGDVLENPVTGERIVFRRVAADTNGELLLFDSWRDDHSELKGLLVPASDDLLVGTPVSPRVNSVQNDDPACLEPVTNLP